jgi:hypothetical protein
MNRNVTQLGHRLRQEAGTIVYAVLRGDAWTIGAALAGLYLLAFGGLFNLFDASLSMVDASVVAGLLCCGFAWVRALRPTLDRALTVAYFAGVVGFFVALAQHNTSASIVLLCLIGATTIALTINRLLRRTAAHTDRATADPR